MVVTVFNEQTAGTASLFILLTKLLSDFDQDH